MQVLIIVATVLSIGIVGGSIVLTILGARDKQIRFVVIGILLLLSGILKLITLARLAGLF